MQVLHTYAEESAMVDDDHLVSLAGLVPVMTLADQTRLPQLLAQKVSITVPRITSGAANPGPKLATLIAGMCADADSIDDIDIARSGGMTTLFGGVYALDNRHPAAGVHLRPRPPTGIGAATTPGHSV